MVVAACVFGDCHFLEGCRSLFSESGYNVGKAFIGTLAARWQNELVTFYLDVHSRIAESEKLMP